MTSRLAELTKSFTERRPGPVRQVRARARPRATGRPRVLIIVQNLSVPFDRRVWLESQALARHGYDVSVVCPKAPGDPGRQVLDGVRLFKYQPYAPGGNALQFVLEYAYSFSASAWLALRVRRDGPLDVLQACNPPEIFWPLARLLRRLDGSRFVFDHHDLSPELFRARFPTGSRLGHRGLLLLERATFAAADHVIATNDSYAAIAQRRGGKSPEQVTTVRNGPDEERLHRVAADPALLRGREHLVAYIGVMGPQDGVDIALRAADEIVHRLGRTDISFTLMGAGDSYPDLLRLRTELGLEDYVDMPGRVSDETVRQVLSTACLGLSPDPSNPLNDVSTMNKTMDYMAFGLPVVAFDLPETRVSARAAARYVTPNDVARYAQAIVDLVDDPVARAGMSRYGLDRVAGVLAWRHQVRAYLGVYAGLVRDGETAARVVTLPEGTPDPTPAEEAPSAEPRSAQTTR